MPGQRTYPHGVTCWVDSEQPDLDAACRFYAGLFGWTVTEATPLGAGGSYRIATLDGATVAGLASLPGAAVGSAAPSPTERAATWNTYVAVDDADATAAAVPGAGGAVVRPPEDAGSSGRTATCTDPSGIEFRLWQPRDLPGARSPTPRAAGTSATCTPATAMRRWPSTLGCSAGSPWT